MTLLVLAHHVASPPLHDCGTGHVLAWKMRYLKGITGKEVGVNLLNVEGRVVLVKLVAKGDVLGEICQVPKRSSRRSLL